MKSSKIKKLEASGWKVGNAEEFLGLSPEEIKYIEIKLKLSHGLRIQRKEKNLSQNQLAQLIRISQSRVAKMEAGDPSVSIDLLVKSLLALGTSQKKIANILS